MVFETFKDLLYKPIQMNHAIVAGTENHNSVENYSVIEKVAERKDAVVDKVIEICHDKFDKCLKYDTSYVDSADPFIAMGIMGGIILTSLGVIRYQSNGK